MGPKLAVAQPSRRVDFVRIFFRGPNRSRIARFLPEGSKQSGLIGREGEAVEHEEMGILTAWPGDFDGFAS